ncbi:MAG: sulfotransferase [Okeania sp. SIO2G4]|uniref:sulfotransferase family protein n=1 Tax=unclassified Okeania TaxID=2634635 RepID=UPI0013BCFC8F|nr:MULTISPECIES: sulfotransferase [unclassified Okeania]NEP03732.1 sulfotransferase [Okeania sp. SIO4D6]NEP38079.1 sulfotransferase [Okeania sp. SIO2H7]NEP74677.1 sulfotransferase [Okeania sp. SIO2G5]NEP95462.1 sulfotransferase [Okeania sp. SIO2F5]NEQ93537.1 sulfotransferase [Okeania sp. SIO2G4]
MNQVQNIVIGGCPRSGTTVLNHLLNAYSYTYIGTELYKLDEYKNFSADFFSKEKIRGKALASLTQQKAKDAYIQKQLQKIEKAQWLGDKYPMIYRYWKNISTQIKGVIFIYTYRDLSQVKSSFHARYKNENDSWSVQAERALDYWQEAANGIIECKSSLGESVIIVKYEDLFFCHKREEFYDIVYSLMSKLKMTEISSESDRSIEKIFQKSLEVSVARKNNLLSLDENEEKIESLLLPQLDELKWNGE